MGLGLMKAKQWVWFGSKCVGVVLVALGQIKEF